MNVLYVEDNDSDARLLTLKLSKSSSQIRLDRVSTIAEAKTKLARLSPENPVYDLVLSDMGLPDGMGSSIVSFLRERQLPIGTVIITGQMREEQGLEALKNGAIDYISKDDEVLERLPALLESALVRHRAEVARDSRLLRVLHGKGPKSTEITFDYFPFRVPPIVLEEVDSTQKFMKKSWKDYDVVVLDYFLEGANGLGFLKELLALEGFDLPIVMVVGESEEEAGLQALRLGAADYVLRTKGTIHQLPWVLENAYNKAGLKKEQAALKESERLYRLISENTGEIVWIVEPQKGKYVYASPSVLHILGYTVEEFLALPSKKLTTPKSAHKIDELTNQLREMTAAGKRIEGFRHDAEIVRKDGSSLWMEAIINGIYDSKGNLTGILGATRDITERKIAEEALRRSEARLSEAMGLASVVYWELDIETREFIFNDAFYNLYATDAEREGGYRITIENYFARFVHPDETERIVTIMERGLAVDTGEAMYEVEHWAKRRDGKDIYILSRTKMFRDTSGQILRISGSNQDITERKEVEEAFKESEVKYRTVVENSVTGVCIVQDGIFRFANARWCEITGYSYEEVVDKRGPGDIIHPDEREYVVGIGDGVLATGVGRESNDRLIRKDGKVISVKVYMGTGFYNGRPAVIVTVIDTTKEKNLELQLRQAQKMEAIGTMAGGVAHDFNNILTVLTGYGTLLEMNMEDGDPKKVYVQQILSASQKAANLTRSLLAFSRRQAIALVPLNLNDLVRTNETLLRRLLSEDVALQTSLCKDNITIMADAIQIDQLLLNLSTNARDAMPSGGVLTIETKLVEADNEFARFHSLDRPGLYALLSVSDTGIGMDSEVKEKIFEPFFTTKEMGKGTGLGLSAVYSAVQQHKGQISVYSEPGHGSTFHVYLPLASAMDLKQQESPDKIEGGSELILVAEDNPDVRNLIKNVLKEYGYKVIEAVDGVDAVDKFLESDHVDLLILDSIMPRLSGRKSYDEICKIKPGVKVLFTSGYTKDAILDKGIEVGHFDFISKPLVPTKLLKKVREILDRPRSAPLA